MASNIGSPRTHRLDRFAQRRLNEIISIPDDTVITTKKAADMLQTTESFLGFGRNAEPPFGPPYHRLSERAGYYVVGEIKSWLTKRGEAFVARGTI
ncbi:MAG: hypothetical protein HN809_12415 [Rhodospirillaceae bacterium]|jgi:hypothetical protein|nr:hypothetical protein [Rhodospirillaceae bacterium]